MQLGSIETTKDMSLDVTVNIAKGMMTAADILNWISDYYSGTVTQLILWDFTEANLSDISKEEFEEIAVAAKKRSYVRAGGKTAFVFSEDLGYGIGRMYQALSELEEIEYECMGFRKIEEAKKWLGI
jgi:ribosome biogenesis protein Nip4